MYIYNLGYYSNEGSGDKKLTFQAIFSEIVEELVKSYGFMEVKFDAEFSAFGWANILDKDYWNDERGESLDKLTNFIKNKPKCTEENGYK